MNRRQFLEYIDHFNHKRWDKVTSYFCPDVTLEYPDNFTGPKTPGRTLHGPQEFIDNYNAKYGYVPADVAALTWDSFRIVQQAIQDCGKITGDLAVDRKCVRDAMANIKNFQGITGEMTFTEEGDPIKCAVIVQITDEGKFAFYKQACP